MVFESGVTKHQVLLSYVFGALRAHTNFHSFCTSDYFLSNFGSRLRIDIEIVPIFIENRHWNYATFLLHSIQCIYTIHKVGTSLIKILVRMFEKILVSVRPAENTVSDSRTDNHFVHWHSITSTECRRTLVQYSRLRSFYQTRLNWIFIIWNNHCITEHTKLL